MKTLMNRTLGLTALFAAQAFTAATAGIVSQSPLFLTSSAKPNIMLLLDSSGSMQHIVPESPYDAGTPYVCSGTALSNAEQVDLGVDSGAPYFTSGAARYLWAKQTAASSACFDATVDYKAQLFVGSGAGAGAQYSGNYLNWYFGSGNDGSGYLDTTPNWGDGAVRKPGTSSRMEIAKTAATALVGSLDSANVGLSSYNGQIGADINISVASGDTAASKTALTNAINALNPSGWTPLAESLLDVGRYFVGTSGTVYGIDSQGHNSDQSCSVNGQYDGALILHPASTPGTSLDDDMIFSHSPGLFESPICHFCQKNFVIMMTDGRATQDQTIPAELQDYDGDCVSGCGEFDMKPAPYSYETDGSSGTEDRNPSDYLDDVAQALYEIDLRPDIDDLDGNEVINNISTYVIGFADDQVLNDPLLKDTAAQGGGLFLQAKDSTALLAALKSAVSDIKAKLSSATAVTTSSTRLNTSTIAFQALFNSGDWSGSLVAFPIGGDGSVGSEVWDAADNIPAHGSRKIFSYNSASSSFAAYEFTDSNLSVIRGVASAAGGSQPTADQVNYIRGDQANESTTGMRVRSSVLGDVINSDPLFVGTPTFGYSQLGSASEGGLYDAYRSTSPYTDRPNMLFVGANDGMLHSFSFDYTNNTATGSELFAYVPSAVVGNLAGLSNQGYSHQYYVDGSVTFSDAYVDKDGMGSGTVKGWRTVLVGTTGAGGSGVYALDISEPESFTAEDVLWDVSANNATNIFFDVGANALNSGVFDDLGFTIGEASIVRMADGHFYAVFGNGYGSKGGKAKLYLVGLDDADGDGDIEVIALDTETTSNGMSSPLVVDEDGDRIADTIYAGDLKGNLWKVDVSSINNTQWGFEFTSGTNPPTPLFTATDGASSQPITAKPQARLHPDEDGVLVLFGTGKYFDTDDSVIGISPQIQTFYAVFDQESVVSRSDLVAQQILSEGVLGNFNVRVTSANEVTYPAKKGWYMDLVLGNDAKGERVVNTALLRDDRVIFTTVIPSADPCAFGGSSWLMEINSLTGARLDRTPFDLDDNGYFDSSDYAPLYNADGSPVLDADGNAVMVAVSGISQTSLGLFDNPAVVEDGTKEMKILGGSSGTITTVKESKSTGGGRQSWQQLQ